MSIGDVVSFGEERQWQETRGGRRCKGRRARGKMKCKTKRSNPCPIYSTSKCIITVPNVTCLSHTIWPSTWQTWRLTVVAHYVRKKRDIITSQKKRPFPVRTSPRGALTASWAHIHIQSHRLQHSHLSNCQKWHSRRKSITDDEITLPNGQKFVILQKSQSHTRKITGMQNRIVMKHSTHASSANVTPIGSVFKISFKEYVR